MKAASQNRLYIGNLAADVAASTLQELFEPYGYVMDVKLAPPDKTRPCGCAFVIMANDESAMAAMKVLNGTALHGLSITVEVAPDEGPPRGAGLSEDPDAHA
jgi:RNA recognition motif-containing protein